MKLLQDHIQFSSAQPKYIYKHTGWFTLPHDNSYVFLIDRPVY